MEPKEQKRGGVTVNNKSAKFCIMYPKLGDHNVFRIIKAQLNHVGEKND